MMAKINVGNAGRSRKLVTFQAYKIACHANGKAYVGITVQGYVRRCGQHFSRPFGKHRGREYDTHLARAVRAHGAAQFSIEHLASATNFEDLLALEIVLIAQHMTLWPLGYNRTGGGEGCLGISRRLTEPDKAAIRASLTGRTLTPEHKANIAAGNRAAMTAEKKLATSLFHNGRRKPDGTGDKISAALIGKPHGPGRSEKRLATMADPTKPRGTVQLPGGRWQAKCMIDGKMQYLGAYDTAEEAHAAYEATRVHQRKPTGARLLPSGKWSARFAGRHLGYFDTQEAATAARNAAAVNGGSS